MWLLWLGCKTPDTLVVAGPNTSIEIELQNPTSCSDCDPLNGLDGLRLEVLDPETGEVLASDSVVGTAGFPAIGGLTGFGQVRIVLRGLSSGVTASVGRTAVVEIDAGAPQVVPMVFVPANRALALTDELFRERSDHVAWRRPDGRVALIGGADPWRETAFEDVEVFDPTTFTFAYETELDGLSILPTAHETATGGLLLVGGRSLGGLRESGTALYDGALVAQSALPTPRSGACVARVGTQKGAVMGGVDPETGDAVVEVMRLGDGIWNFDRAEVFGLDGALVGGCVGLDDARIFVMGEGAASSGFFSYSGDDLRFDALDDMPSSAAVDHALSLVTLAGHVRTFGGVTQGGVVSDQVWDFRPDDQTWVEAEALTTARALPDVKAWILPDVAVVGCGYADSGLTAAESTVEIAGTQVELDRARPGCSIAVLHDGMVLVTGGFDANTQGNVGALIIAPG